ncbi:PGF-pre-PGF domain-containing protein [uncultured Methanoregula sp.]|uniref:PGF-pre-PGF domain-containing protein n=1 Tax=uncultured Methanoregula sp. TaxID=1005933 RepID=UPI002AAC3D24|nr:PGF-pre-PGF domain-containing protein [uncultured Methanoregula sp.]
MSCRSLPSCLIISVLLFLLILCIVPVSGVTVYLPDRDAVPALLAGSSAGSTFPAFQLDRMSGTWSAFQSNGRTGITVAGDGSVIFSAPAGSFGMQCNGIGRNGALSSASIGTIRADRDQLTIGRGTATEWYISGSHGIEQGMTIPDRPEGEGPLVVSYALFGSLHPIAKGDQSVLFFDNTGPVMQYGGLRAEDATGRVLPAFLKLSGNSLTWEIDDHNAVYPVTIDPYIATQMAALTASDAASHTKYGWSVSIWNDTAMVGANEADYGGLSKAGKAYIYKNSGGTWSQVGSPLNASDAYPDSYFGWSVSIWNDTAMVGAYQARHGELSNRGEVYVFKNNGGTWSEVCPPLTASDAFDGGHFGSAVSIYNDTAIIGSYQAGTPGQSGQAYIFKNSGGTWSQVGLPLVASDAASSDHFGYSASIWNDTAIVGAHDANSSAGKAYIFKNSGGTWSQVGSPLEASDVESSSDFGWSVSISNYTAIIGAYYANNRAGKAYIFKNSGGTWSQVGSPLIASDDASYSEFGYSASIWNDTAIVGARRMYSGTGYGKAYIFKNSGGTWSEIVNFNASDAVSGDWFGASVSIFKNTTSIGAYNVNSEAGKAYVFNITETFLPVASFTSANVSVVANSTTQGWAGFSPFTMQFTDTSTNTPTTWAWARNNLTDTTWRVFNTSQNAQDTFWIGNWSVNLTATNPTGSSISSQTLWVNVSPLAPVASFTSANVSVVTNSTTQGWAGFSPFTMQFTDTSANAPTTWAWARNNLTSTSWTAFNTSQNARDSFWIGNWTVNLTATNPTGSSISSQTLWVNVSQAAPTVTGITPSSGQNTTSISITNLAGTGFYGVPAVNLTRAGYSNITATSVSQVSASQLTCSFNLANTDPGTWNVNVTNPDGQQAALLNGFTITNTTPAPTVTSITPSSGKNSTSVSITNLAGSGFYGTPTVKLTRLGYSNIMATGVTVVSSGKITCTFDLSDKMSGTWSINVVNPDNQAATLPNGFTITNSSAPTPTPTPTPNPTPTSSGSGDVGNVQRQSTSSGSGVSIANGAPAGQTVTYSFGEPAVDYPVSIESIAFTPDQTIGQSQCLVTRTSPTAGFTVPDRPAVYESIQITWINPNVMSDATIQFSVKGSWMREHNAGPQDIVMMRQHDLVWAEIPTVFDHLSNDIYYFRSTTPGFSNFAVSVRKNVTAISVVNITTVPAPSPAVINTAAATMTTTTKSTPTSTMVRQTSPTPTPVPVPAAEPGTGIPVLYIIAGIVIIILAIAGFFIGRRWWWARQNPALFQKYD